METAEALRTCAVCRKPIAKPTDSISTGYASRANGESVCYSCCAAEDRQWMIDNGNHGGLYLTKTDTGFKVCNWPDTLSFPVLRRIESRQTHFGGRANREDFWFYGPDGFIWHGVVRGDMQLARCRRTKRTSL